MKNNQTQDIKVADIEIEIDATENNTPTKYDKRRKRWPAACAISMLAVIISVLALIIGGLNEITAASGVVSILSFILSLCNAGKTYPGEPGWAEMSDSAKYGSITHTLGDGI